MARRLKRWQRRVLAYGLLVLLLPIMGFGCADALILHPSDQPIDAGAAKRRVIDIGPAKVVEAWCARSYAGDAPPEAYALCFVGNAQRAEDVAADNAMRWSPHRVEAWTVNYPGYGGSTGPARLKAIPPAALKAYDALAAQAGGKPIFLTSNSLGGTAAMYVAANRPVAGMIVQNPPALREVVLHQGWWNLWLLAGPVALSIPDELETPPHAAKVAAPAIFITAETDNVVMPKFQDLTIDAYAGPKQRLSLRHKGHNDVIDSADEWAAFRERLDWLWQQTAAAGDPTRKGSI